MADTYDDGKAPEDWQLARFGVRIASPSDIRRLTAFYRKQRERVEDAAIPFLEALADPKNPTMETMFSLYDGNGDTRVTVGEMRQFMGAIDKLTVKDQQGEDLTRDNYALRLDALQRSGDLSQAQKDRLLAVTDQVFDENGRYTLGLKDRDQLRKFSQELGEVDDATVFIDDTTKLSDEHRQMAVLLAKHQVCTTWVGFYERDNYIGVDSSYQGSTLDGICLAFEEELTAASSKGDGERAPTSDVRPAQTPPSATKIAASRSPAAQRRG